MFQRTALQELQKWSEKSDRKPLILRGARQVGKTTLVDAFSQGFDTYLYINLEITQATNLFEIYDNIHELLEKIFFYCNKPREKGRVMLFIDEIQNSPKAVAQLRYFYEEIPDLYVIAAGSLLENMIDRKISFPVGRVEFMPIRPCDFIEFLGAIEEENIKELVLSTSIPDVLHQRATSLFNTYTLIGGMPAVVKEYAARRDIVSLNSIYESLLTSYADDVEKYARNQTMTNVIRFILSAGYTMAAETITMTGFAGSTYKSREMSEAFRTLEKAMLLELAYPITSTTIPIIGQQRRAPKLLWLDTGLVNYAAGIQTEVFGQKDILDAWRGLIAEHIVAQELLAAHKSLLYKRYFWINPQVGTTSEVDFVIQFRNYVIPIEVKSGTNSKLKSLHVYMNKAPHHTAIRVWSGAFGIDKVITPEGKEFNLINVPFYYVSQLESILSKRDI